MAIRSSGEDYLEAILVLYRKNGVVRSIDVARHLNYSKPSVSHAVGLLRESGHIIMADDGSLHLTDSGREIAEKIYERHCVIAEGLVKLGVDAETAEEDACKIEHVVSDISFEKLRGLFQSIE